MTNYPKPKLAAKTIDYDKLIGNARHFGHRIYWLVSGQPVWLFVLVYGYISYKKVNRVNNETKTMTNYPKPKLAAKTIDYDKLIGNARHFGHRIYRLVSG